MFSFLNSLTNPYDRKARIAPVVLCAVPLFAPILFFVPEFGQNQRIAIALFLYCGGAFFLVQVGRDRGKKLEPTLYKKWCGKPSVAMLRHLDGRINSQTKSRYRNFLQRAVPELTLASREEERSNPEEADRGYESANSWLLANTRDKERFNLLFTANINYGFRRNMWALKSWAISLDVCALLVSLVWIGIDCSWKCDFPTTFHTIQATPLMWVSLIIICIHSLFFALIIRPNWVKVSAEGYAKQLLEACDSFEKDFPT